MHHPIIETKDSETNTNYFKKGTRMSEIDINKLFEIIENLDKKFDKLNDKVNDMNLNLSNRMTAIETVIAQKDKVFQYVMTIACSGTFLAVVSYLVYFVRK